MNFNEMIQRLNAVYDQREARSIAKVLLADGFGMDYVDVCLGALDMMKADDRKRLEAAIDRLEKGEPVQYFTGKEWFCGRVFHVEKGVLIPRPETEELIDWIKSETDSCDSAIHLLDIGCGSGCISVTLALELRNVITEAWDVSPVALRIAEVNAEAHGANVAFKECDALADHSEEVEMWDVIVSNPPYICDSEKETMRDNVLAFEPHLALFVPDEDPLLFYRAIATYATHALRKGGRLFFEINEAYGTEVCELMTRLGLSRVELRKDQFGRDRMVRGIKL